MTAEDERKQEDPEQTDGKEHNTEHLRDAEQVERTRSQAEPKRRAAEWKWSPELPKRSTPEKTRTPKATEQDLEGAEATSKGRNNAKGAAVAATGTAEAATGSAAAATNPKEPAGGRDEEMLF